MKASDEILNRLELYGAEWKRWSIALWDSPEFQFRYPQALKVSYQVIRASVPLLELARDRAQALADRDPVAVGLATYLARHAEEERGHDEWMRQDLLALGVSEEELDLATPSPNVAGMVGAQYYWCLHAHPVAILGYIAVLEGEPPDEAVFHEAAHRSGLPETAFRTLRYHARVDREHWRELLELADALPFTASHLSLIGLSILHTCTGMETALRSALELPVHSIV